MAKYLIVLNEVERTTVLSALERSTVYGSHAKSFAVLIDKVAEASPLEEERGERQDEEVRG